MATLSVGTVVASRGEQITVPIMLAESETVGGIQFKLRYDPLNLTYISFTSASIYNDSVPGELSVSMVDLAGLPSLIGEITFTVHDRSDLTFSDILLSDAMGMEILDYAVTNGAVEANGMIKTFQWNDPNEPDLNDYILYEGVEGPDPAVNAFTPVASSTTPQVDHDVPENDGEHHYYVTGNYTHIIFGSGETDPSPVLTVNTDLPMAMGPLTIV